MSLALSPVGSRPDAAGLLRRHWPLLPLAATVLLLLAPIAAGDASTSGKVGPADAASLLLVFVCAVQALRGRVRELSPLGVLVLGVPAVGLAVATATAGDPHAALPGFVRYLQVFVLVPAAIVLLVRDAGEFRLAAGCFVVLALVQGAVGVVQYATHTGASYQGADVRAVGTFGPGDVMGMATVVAYGLVVATAAALAPGLPRRVRQLAGGAALVLVVPLVLSFSRGAWIATAGTAVLVMLLAGIRRALKVLLALAAAGVVLVGGLGVGSAMVVERLTSITQVSSAPDQSVTDRYTMWAAAESMWRERPAVGVGLKGFPANRDGHSSLGLSSGSDTAGAGQAYIRQPLLSPHNMYLLVLSEQGLVGLTALAGGWAALLVAGLRRCVTGGFGLQDCGLIAIGLFVWQLTDFLYADIGGPSTVLTGVIIGLAAWWALPSPSAGEAVPGGPGRPGARTALGAGRGPGKAAAAGGRTGLVAAVRVVPGADGR
ncbi:MULTISPECIES: O-antigen ligase family protein [unclassified Streptomyces]|uniref:O-antigen ligase family protein n=1 Tax=unclassified Streptomyces TaxID=2593676 RepID=UPI00225533B5|nr:MULTISPECIES: O-antigen ligase family protein [unclassified Streptomyces]MCX5147255.1 O-antigen ligase family protein [Streptomyces sp. NBC_00320]WSN50394.1 O-antigen ligase family protein [Streptomyces sp. NBC_01296]WSW60168.1 O-antigen ligase family protein [Streptomyces sp. NBC_00998]